MVPTRILTPVELYGTAPAMRDGGGGRAERRPVAQRLDLARPRWTRQRGLAAAGAAGLGAGITIGHVADQ